MTVYGPDGEPLAPDNRIYKRFTFHGQLDAEGNLINADLLSPEMGEDVRVKLYSWDEGPRSGYKNCPVWVTVTVDVTDFKG